MNSIGYRHHVEHLEDFIGLMADAGANRVLLIPLSACVPQLAHHVSIPRTWVEGEILKRARRLARKRDIEVGFDLYEAILVSTEHEYEVRRQAIFSGLGVAMDAPGLSIADIRRMSVDAERPVRDRVPVPVPGEGERASEGFTSAADLGAEGIFCFEPFYTLYLSRNGDFKPCCNATLPIQMGDVRSQTAVQAWRGSAFETVRETILAGGYPRMCSSCVKYEPHPQHNFVNTAGAYREWFERGTGERLPKRWDAVTRGIIAAGSNVEIVRRQNGEVPSEVSTISRLRRGLRRLTQ